jgi:hypothetical protein
MNCGTNDLTGSGVNELYLYKSRDHRYESIYGSRTDNNPLSSEHIRGILGRLGRNLIPGPYNSLPFEFYGSEARRDDLKALLIEHPEGKPF